MHTTHDAQEVSFTMGRLGTFLRASERRTDGFPASWVAGVAGMVAAWYKRTLQRQALAQLDDRLLKDIGITRAQAGLEARKPFWVM